MGTLLNGQRVTQAPLFHGAVIQVGSNVMEFMMKTGVTPIRAAEQLHGQVYVPTPIPAQPAGVAMAPVPATGMPMTMPSPTMSVAHVASHAIVALSGPITGQKFAVPGPLEIGREGSGLALGFDTVASRRHASLAPAVGGLLLTDLGSTNGTFVNDQRIQSTTIRPGDIVRIGNTTFRVE